MLPKQKEANLSSLDWLLSEEGFQCQFEPLVTDSTGSFSFRALCPLSAAPQSRCSACMGQACSRAALQFTPLISPDTMADGERRGWWGKRGSRRRTTSGIYRTHLLITQQLIDLDSALISRGGFWECKCIQVFWKTLKAAAQVAHGDGTVLTFHPRPTFAVTSLSTQAQEEKQQESKGASTFRAQTEPCPVTHLPVVWTVVI